MRDRRGIEKLLSAQALDHFLQLAENDLWSFSVREEALKCMINSIYSRPDFVSEYLSASGFITRLLSLAETRGTITLHWLVWKFLLVSCEAPEVPRHLSCSLETWQLIYVTLLYGFKLENMAEIVVGPRSNLLLDLTKLIYVLVNEMQWTAEQERRLPGISCCSYRLGGLFLEILRFRHPAVSPLHVSLLELKNSVVEVLMLAPGSSLRAFIQQQKGDGNQSTLLSTIINHLHTMLGVVRIEKMRPLKEMLPTLVVCHNLAETGDQEILTCFKTTVLPTSEGCSSAEDERKAFYFKHLISFLTCLDTDVRRYASEWLFLLCDQSGKHFIYLTFFLSQQWDSYAYYSLQNHLYC